MFSAEFHWPLLVGGWTNTGWGINEITSDKNWYKEKKNVVHIKIDDAWKQNLQETTSSFRSCLFSDKYFKRLRIFKRSLKSLLYKLQSIDLKSIPTELLIERPLFELNVRSWSGWSVAAPAGLAAHSTADCSFLHSADPWGRGNTISW